MAFDSRRGKWKWEREYKSGSLPDREMGSREEPYLRWEVEVGPEEVSGFS